MLHGQSGARKVVGDRLAEQDRVRSALAKNRKRSSILVQEKSSSSGDKSASPINDNNKHVDNDNIKRVNFDQPTFHEEKVTDVTEEDNSLQHREGLHDEHDDYLPIDLGEIKNEAMGSNSKASVMKVKSMTFNVRRVVGKLQEALVDEPATNEALMEREKRAEEHRKRMKKVFNFSVGKGANTKLFRYEDVSFCFFTKRNRMRQFCVRLTAHATFKKFILFMIVVNALIFAASDYRNVDSSGKLLAQGSWINALNDSTNGIFVALFAVEMLLKMIAQGVWGRHGSYVSSPWNVLDLVVVITGVLVLASSDMENVSALRMIRVLRPLRSLKMIPAMRNIISSIFVSIPELGGVFSLMGFIFFLFAIAGMNIFAGASIHSRCRSTPYPVKLDYVSPMDNSSSPHKYEDFRCLDAPNFDVASNFDDVDKSSSPWNTPQDCYWPLAPVIDEDVRMCSLEGVGFNNCVHDTTYVDEKEWTWCGSNWDALGNRRFKSPGYQMYGNGFYPKNDIDIYNSELNFGYSNFDNFGVSLLTIFQSITEEGWTHILYMYVDAHGWGRSVPFFILLVLFGVYFVLQLLLAVLEENFSSATRNFKQVEAKETLEREEKIAFIQSHHRESTLYIAIIEQSNLQLKLLKNHLTRILPEYTDKEIYIKTYHSPKQFLSRYGNKVERLVQDFDVLITREIFNTKNEHDNHEFMMGHELIAFLRNLPTGPLFRMEHMIAIANLEMHKDILINAGASMVIAPAPVDFDKEVSGVLHESLDIVHTVISMLGLGKEIPAKLEHVEVDIFSENESDAGDQEEPVEAKEAVGILRDPDSSGSDSDYDAHAEEASIFTTKYAAHDYEDIFRKAFKTGVRIACLTHKNLFSADAMMEITVKPANVLIHTVCDCCGAGINYHYMRCRSCKVNVCMECAAGEWKLIPKFQVEDVIPTMVGPCKIQECRTGGYSPESESKSKLNPTVTVICQPTQWSLANDCKPTLYLQADNIQMPPKPGVRDKVRCRIGGTGVIKEIRAESFNNTNFLRYEVELIDWCLAGTAKVVMTVSEVEIIEILESNLRIREHHLEMKLRDLDNEAAKVDAQHDSQVSSPRRSIKKPKLIKQDSNASSMSVVSTNSGQASDVESRKTMDPQDGLSDNKGISTFIKKRVDELTKVSFKKIQKEEFVDDLSIFGDDWDSTNAALVAMKDPKTFVKLPQLERADLVGKNLDEYLRRISVNIRQFFSWSVGPFKLQKSLSGKSHILKDTDELSGFPYFQRIMSLRCKAFVEWKYFDFFSGSFILLNSAVLMCDYYPMDSTSQNTLDTFNALLTMIFALEMITIVIARGINFYYKDFMSGFDGFVVIASMVDLCIAPPAYWSSGSYEQGRLTSLSSTISLLRCFRLFRMIKLGLKIRSLKILLFRVVKTFYHLGAFVILLGVLLFCYTVAGLQFFANRFRFNEAGDPITDIGSVEWQNAPEISRYNFDDFSLAFASVFQLLTTENWNDIMFDTWRVYGPLGVLFPVSVVLVGTFVLMNLFLGILLGNFTGDDAAEALEDLVSLRKLELRAVEEEDGGEEYRKVDTDSAIASIFGDVHQGLKLHGERGQLKLQSMKSIKSGEGIEMMSLVSSPASSNASHSASPYPSLKKESSDYVEVSAPTSGDIELTSISKSAKSDDHEASTPEANSAKSASRQEDDWMRALLKRIGFEFDEEAENNDDDDDVPSSPTNSKRVIKLRTSVKSLDISGATAEPKIEDSVFPLNPCKTIGLFGAESPVRLFCANLLNEPYFEVFIQVLIFLSSLSLILGNPLENPGTSKVHIIRYFDMIFTALFTIEALIKIITLGFVMNTRAYLRNGWNILDFVIVVASLLAELLKGNFKGVKAIRSFRALRPLRVISRAPGLRIIVNALFASIPDVLNVVGVILVLFSIFSVLAVNFLKGDLRHCTGPVFEENIANNADALHLLTYPVPYGEMSKTQQAWFSESSTIRTFPDCSSPPCCNLDIASPGLPSTTVLPTSKMICDCWGGDWDPVAYQTFDNYFEGLLAFTAISTTEGWIDLMYAAVDSRGIEMQPVLNQKYAFIYFFIFFIVIGAFFAMNLFVGVMIDNFGRTKQEQGAGMVFMTPEQQEWLKTYQLVKLIKPHVSKKPPGDRWGDLAFKICKHRYFENGILAGILANSLVLASSFFGMSDELSMTFEIINLLFALLFTMELGLKLFAYRWTYARSKWNIFDAVVTIGTDIGCFIYIFGGSKSGLSVMVIRIFRVLRVVRLIEGLGNAKRLIDTLMFTLPGIINISLLLLLLLFIYAALGMQLFATVAFKATYDRYANFRTFGTSLLTLFRFTTGEGWGNYMFDVAFQTPGCVDDPPYDENMCGFTDRPGCIPLNGCGSDAIFAYMISFTVIVAMVIFNLFIGVILEGFQSANDSSGALRNDDFKTFVKHWARFDPDGGLFVSIDLFEEFVATLPGPMGLAEIHPSHQATVAYLTSMDLKVYQREGVANFIHFKDALTSLSAKAIESQRGGDVDELSGLVDFAQDATYHQTLRSGTTAVKTFKRSDDVTFEYTLREYYAALLVQHALRRNLAKKLLNERRSKNNLISHSTFEAISAFSEGSDEFISRVAATQGNTRKVKDRRATLLGTFVHDAASLVTGSYHKVDSESDDEETPTESDSKVVHAAHLTSKTAAKLKSERLGESHTKEDEEDVDIKIIVKSHKIKKKLEEKQKDEMESSFVTSPGIGEYAEEASDSDENLLASDDDDDEEDALTKQLYGNVDTVDKTEASTKGEEDVVDMIKRMRAKREAMIESEKKKKAGKEDEPATLTARQGITNFFKSLVLDNSASNLEFGEKKFSNGDKYHGLLNEGVMEGYGFYQYNDGAIYEGEMHRGQRHGIGTYQSTMGERYIGEFKHNQRHGRGVKYCLDGQILDGQWQYGVFITDKPFASSAKK